MNPVFNQDINPIMRRLQDSFQPISLDDLQRIGSELGIDWPADFVEFILRYNGGYFHHPVEFDVREPDGWVMGGTIQGMNGLFPGDPDCEDDIRMTAYRLEYIPDYTLPIAGCWGDHVLLGIRGDDYGNVYLWDHNEGGPENIHLVADNFTEFIVGLRPGDEVLDRPDEEAPEFQDVASGNEAAVKNHLAGDGNVDERNARDETLLMCAAHWSWPRIVKHLIEHGASLDARDAEGQTPLFFAVRGQSIDSIKLLAGAGANLSARDSRGRCAVKCARDLNFWPQANKLVELGAPER